MWIETEDGKLINLDFIELIDALEGDDRTEPGIYAFPPSHYECAMRTRYLIVSTNYLRKQIEQDAELERLLTSTTLLINMLGLITDILDRTKARVLTSNEWLAIFRKQFGVLKKSLLDADRAASRRLGFYRRPSKKGR